MGDGAAYLEKFGVQDAISQAVTKVLKARPADPISAIGDILMASANGGLGKPSFGVGAMFPTTPVVQVGFKNAMPVSKLFEGMSKVLFVTLPGAFTPT